MTKKQVTKMESHGRNRWPPLHAQGSGESRGVPECGWVWLAPMTTSSQQWVVGLDTSLSLPTNLGVLLESGLT